MAQGSATNYILGNIGIGKSTTAKTKLEVLGTISGSTLFGTSRLATSGSLSVDTTALIKGNLTNRGTFSGAALQIMAQGSAGNYVLGNLGIGKSTTAKTKLEVLGTISGSTVFATSKIHTSGSLSVGTTALIKGNITNRGTFSGAALQIMAQGSAGNYVLGNLGIGKSTTAKTKLEVLGTISGSTVFATSKIHTSGSLVVGGALTFKSLTNCDTIDTDANGVLSCGSDTGAGGGGDLYMEFADTRYVNVGGDTMTGALIIDGSTDTIQLTAQASSDQSANTVVFEASDGTDWFTVDSDGDARFTKTVAIGGIASQVYNIISDSGTASHTGGGEIEGDNDLYLEGAFEMDGLAFIDNRMTITRAATEEFIRLTGSNTADSVGIYTGNSSPESATTAQLGSFFLDSGNGKVYVKAVGDDDNTGWQEVATVSPGSPFMALANARYVSKQGDTMTGALIIDGGTNTIQLTAQASSDQSNNTVVFEASDGTDWFTVDSDGDVAMSQDLQVTESVAIGGIASQVYNIISDSGTASHTGGGEIEGDNDLYLEGAFEMDGLAFIDNRMTITRAATEEFIRLTGSNTADSVGIYTGNSSPESATTAQLGSFFLDSGNGKVYVKAVGDDDNTGWQEVATVSPGSPFMALANARYVSKQGDTMTGALIIDGGTNTIQLTAQASSDQSNNTVVFEASDGTDWFTVDSDGDVAMSQDVSIDGSITSANTGLLFAKPLAIGGASVEAYTTISDTGTAGHADIASDDDLYVEGALEIDGAAYFDDTVVIGGYSGGLDYNMISGGGSAGQADIDANTDLFIEGALEIDGKVYFDQIGDCDGTNMAIRSHDGELYCGDVTTDGSDYAEHYPTMDPTLGSGEVIAIDSAHPGYVRRSSGSGTQRIIGIVSTKPGMLLRGDPLEFPGARRVAVALNGRVPVRVSGENGAINVGDAVAPGSRSGTAKKASEGDVTLGYALQAFTGSTLAETGSVVVYVNLQDAATAVASAESIHATELLSSSGALHIAGPALFGSGVTIAVNETNGLASVLRIESDANGQDDTVFRVTAGGDVHADGAFTGGGADYAEWFLTADTNLKFGEAVCIDSSRPNSVRRCTRSGDLDIIGLVSSKEQAAFIGNKFAGAEGLPVPGTVLVGLLGQLSADMVVEDSESGPLSIRPGDSLAAGAIPGTLRKALAGESTVGVALEGLESGRAMKKILISRKNTPLTVEAVSDRVLQTVKDLKIEDELQLSLQQAIDDFSASGTLVQPIAQEVRRQIAGMSLQSITERLALMESRLAALSGSLIPNPSLSPNPTMSLSGSVTLQDLRAQTLSLEESLAAREGRFAGDLYVDGMFHVRELFVPNGIRVDGGLHAASLEVQSGAVINGTLTLNSDLQVTKSMVFGSGSVLSAQDLIVRGALHVLGPITIDGLARFLGEVRISGQLTLSSRQAGFASVGTGETLVRVAFGSGMTAVPVVTVTPQGRVGSEWWTENVTATGFTLSIGNPAARNILFGWTALAVEDPRTTHGLGADILSESIAFPVDPHGVPVSTSEAWNSCIRNHPLLTEDGSPVNCGGYHDGYSWQHPELGITFIYNTSVSPALLLLPDGYVTQVVTTPEPQSVPEPEPESEPVPGPVPESSVPSDEELPASEETPPSDPPAAQESAEPEAPTEETAPSEAEPPVEEPVVPPEESVTPPADPEVPAAAPEVPSEEPAEQPLP